MSQSARSVWTRAAAGIPAIALAVSGLTVAPQDVQAQTTAPTIGQCVAPAVLSEQLKAQDQKIIYGGTRNGLVKNSQGKEYAYKLGLNATSTPDGKNGYLVQQCNDDFGKASGMLKAELNVTGVRLYSDALKAPLPEMKISIDNKIAAKACASSERATCEPHNVIIDKIYAHGGYIAYQALSPASGNIITISSGPDKVALIHLTDSKTGASTGLGMMSNADYSAFAINVGKKIPVDMSVAALSAPTVAAIPAANVPR